MWKALKLYTDISEGEAWQAIAAYFFLDATALSCNAKLSRWLAGWLADTF